MRRFVACALLLLLVGQSSGVAFAANTGPSGGGFNILTAVVDPLRSAITSSKTYALATGTADRYAAMHASPPRPVHATTEVDAAKLMRAIHPLRPRLRHGVRAEFALPARSDLHRKRLDPLAMRRSAARPTPTTEAGAASFLQALHTVGAASVPQATHPLALRRGRIKPLTSSSPGTGIEHWWTYEEHAIPGIGKAMVNVGTGNFLATSTDVDVPEQGIDLAFQRVYNSQSLHDYNGDDGGNPAIFGNRWTNNFDANMVYDSSGPTITVYDLDGAACTYTSDGLGNWVPCTGEYATLAPTDGTDCTYALTKTNGTTYLFRADVSGPPCDIQQAKQGHIVEILGRNENNTITLNYSYNGSGNSSEDVTEIDADHSDGDKLTMLFGIIPGTSINELATIVRPDGAQLNYLYDTRGNLVEVDKPGNDSANSVPAPPRPSPTLPPGDVPETYAYGSGTSTLVEACGPRCTAAMWSSPSNPSDGGALVFASNGGFQLKNWQFQGVLNFTPPDNTATPLQGNQPAGFVTWYQQNFDYGQGSDCSNTSAGTTTMCDTDGHSTIWTTDANNRVTQTQSWTGTAEALWLVTEQGWDIYNNLTSTEDANGNTTKYGYDTGGYNAGNMVEMLQPRTSDITNGPLSPLSTYSYDQYHNIIAYCDAVYNQTNGNTWVDSPGDSLCSGTKGTTSLTFNQTSLEPFGCLTNITKPSGYKTDVSYPVGNGQCGFDLPSEVAADQVIQQYGSEPSRQPTQDLTYDGKGNLTAYDKGSQNGNTLDSWTLQYDQQNLLMQRTENDPVLGLTGSSFSCHYADGSLFYTETPSQHDADGDPPCPKISTLLAGSVKPPSKATAYYYDLDGNQLRAVTHKGCTANNGCPGPQAMTACSTTGQSDIGTTCKYYDGMDRLVETIEPYDTRNSGGTPYEFYAFRWMNRYIYDLSQSGGSANLQIYDSTGTASGIVAYGNLYKTKEYLPQTTGMLAVLSNGQYNSQNATFAWSDVRGTDFDGIDRPVAKYELAYHTTGVVVAVTSNSWDASGDLGNLSSTTNAVGQVTTYAPHDNLERVQDVSFSGTSPRADPRLYTYDADGRTASAENSMGTLVYSYDVDGNETSVKEPAAVSSYAPSLICYSYYPDGLREYLSIGPSTVDSCGDIQQQKNPSNNGISQPDIFSYSYEQDGRVKSQQVNWVGVQDTFSWSYAPSGRELTETDPLKGKTAYIPPNDTQSTTFGKKTYQYDEYGRVSGYTLPEGYAESAVAYDTDDEFVGAQEATSTRTTTLNARGEIIADGAGQYETAQAFTYMANGTQVGDGSSWQNTNAFVSPPSGLQYDVRSGMVTVAPDILFASTADGADVYTFDAAGRKVKTDNWDHWPSGGSNSSSSYKYDAENHFEEKDSGGLEYGSIQWGPDGHDRIETTYHNYPNTTDYTNAHWDGDTILFDDGNQQGSAPAAPTLYIGKLGSMTQTGAIKVIDRDQSGQQQTTHGFDGTTYWYEGWSLGTVRSVYIPSPKGQGQVMNAQIVTGSCDFYTGQTHWPCPSAAGTAFGMQRSDGYSMMPGIVQGARAMDPVTAQWTTPDAYAGDVKNPMSQKPFTWNNNNPVAYSDPSGFDALIDIDTADLPILGHIQIIIYEPGSSTGTLLSVQSRDGKAGGDPIVVTESPVVLKDLPTKGHDYFHVTTTTAQNVVMQSTYTSAESSGNYNIATNNCDDWAQAALSNAGTGVRLAGLPVANKFDLPLEGLPEVDPAHLSPQSSSSIDPLTGFSISFENNVQQSESFTNENQEYVY